MSEITRKLKDGTLVDLKACDGQWSRELIEILLPSLVRRLEKRFGNLHGASPVDAVASAVRSLLASKTKELRFESAEDLRRWLYTVAWRKAKDAVKKEHLADRVAPELAGEPYAREADLGCEEASGALNNLREIFDQKGQIVLDGKLADKTHKEIAQENGWTETEINTIWKRICRKGKQWLKARGEP